MHPTRRDPRGGVREQTGHNEMSVTKLEVSERTATGSNANARIRSEGGVPGVLYGLGRDPRNLQFRRETFDAFLRDGARLVDLDLGGKTQPAFLKDLQFDPISHDVLHADFMRVDLAEKLTLRVPLTFTGIAKGQTAGGRVDAVATELEVECLPDNIPEEISVSVLELDLGETWHANEIELPKGVTPITPDEPVVTCAVVTEEEAEGETEDAEGGDAPAEPEVMTRKEESEGE